MTPAYRNQVELLISVLAFVAREPMFALHGGTAINLFLDDMPRLSVDIDLTYVPIAEREPSLADIKQGLEGISADIRASLRGVTVTYSQPARLTVQSGRAAIKVEVNTTMRGLLAEPQIHTLCAHAQETFDMEVAVPLAPLHQIIGGKLVAALDRQHPRDLFDVRRLFTKDNLFDTDGKLGFMLALLSSARPFHEVLNPTLHDQRNVMANQFVGMTDEPFSYDEFEHVRSRLIGEVQSALSAADKAFLRSVMRGSPDWQQTDYAGLDAFPAVRWKLHHIDVLRRDDHRKHAEQMDLLNQVLDGSVAEAAE